MNDDLINRQAAIDEWKNDFKGYVNALNIPRDDYNGIMEYIDELPSAQPEQRWISVSERLPDKETYVLISQKPHPLTGKKWCVTIAGRFVDERSRRIEWRDIGFGRIGDDKILAWMPLPEPYLGEGE